MENIGHIHWMYPILGQCLSDRPDSLTETMDHGLNRKAKFLLRLSGHELWNQRKELNLKFRI